MDATQGTKREWWVCVSLATVLLLLGMSEAFALTNNLATALTVTSGVSTGFDTGATIGLSILVFLVALGFVLKGIRVGKKAS